jgi:hypothetical protein
MNSCFRSSSSASCASVHSGSLGSENSFFSFACRTWYRIAVERWSATRSPRWLM